MFDEIDDICISHVLALLREVLLRDDGTNVALVWGLTNKVATAEVAAYVALLWDLA